MQTGVKIEKYQLHHGAALTQIVEHGSFKALNTGSPKYGHYLVNGNVHVFVKYLSKDGAPWRFAFKVDEMDAIARVRLAAGEGARLFLALVCGYSTVCCIDWDQLRRVMDPRGDELDLWVSVAYAKGQSMRVEGPRGALPNTVRHSSFPEVLFET